MRVDPALADFARDEVKRQLGRSTRISHVEALQVGGHHAVLLLTVEPSSRRLVLKVAGPGDKRAIDYDRTATVTALLLKRLAHQCPRFSQSILYRAGPWRYSTARARRWRGCRYVRPLLDGDEVSPAHRSRSLRPCWRSVGPLLVLFRRAERPRSTGCRRSPVPCAAEPRSGSLSEHAQYSFNRLLDREAALFVMGNQAADA